jgi:L-aminopeptidase/D-esterase-like protein
VGAVNVPIVPGAVLFDLLNGGDKDFCGEPLYWRLGYQAARSAAKEFRLGSEGAGFGATTFNLKGGLGSASDTSSNGFRIGALVAVNSLGRVTIGDGPHFWAAPYEKNREFGGLAWPLQWPAGALDCRVKGDDLENTTIAIVATDADMTKAEAKRLAIMAHDGMAHAIRPAHAAIDGDTVFAAATGASLRAPTIRDRTEIGMLAADCLARAIARAIFEASPLPFAGASPTWRQKFGTG